MKNIKITPIQLYRLLVGECRYAYTRNNHLQPSCAYDEVKEFLPKMYKADPMVALDTASQLCAECISDELSAHFYEGLDDEFGNRENAIDFIEYLIDFINAYRSIEYKPYNYGLFEELKNKSDSLKYNIYKIDKFDFKDENVSKIKKDLISKNLVHYGAQNLLFNDIIGEDSVYCNKRDVMKSKYSSLIIGNAYRILKPSKRAGEIYLIILSNEGE